MVTLSLPWPASPLEGLELARLTVIRTVALDEAPLSSFTVSLSFTFAETANEGATKVGSELAELLRCIEARLVPRSGPEQWRGVARAGSRWPESLLADGPPSGS